MFKSRSARWPALSPLTLLTLGALLAQSVHARAALTRLSLERAVTSELRQSKVPGAALVVVSQGEPVWQLAYGVRRAGSRPRVTLDTPFMLGSVSKTVLGTALMQAVQAGRLSWDAPIDRWLSFPVRRPGAPQTPLTLRQLATHTAGLLDDQARYAASYAPGDPQMPLTTFLRSSLVPGGALYHPRQFSPGRSAPGYAYSNIGAGLAAAVLEGATGQPLNVWAQTHIFGPLGMRDTHYFLREFAAPDKIASPHDAQGRALPHYGYPTWPDGQLRASAHDLARFLATVMNGGSLHGARLLDPAALRSLLTPQGVTDPDSGDLQALFWTHKHGLIGHSGGDEGVLTLMYFDPETRLGAVLLMNQQTVASARAAAAIMRLVLRDTRVPGLFGPPTGRP